MFLLVPAGMLAYLVRPRGWTVVISALATMIWVAVGAFTVSVMNSPRL